MAGDLIDSTIFATKSGAKRIFDLCEVPTAVGCRDIHEPKDFYKQLTKLVANNLYTNTWLFKIDNEFNGRGHASLQVDQIKTILELRKKKVEMTEAIIEKL